MTKTFDPSTIRYSGSNGWAAYTSDRMFSVSIDRATAVTALGEDRVAEMVAAYEADRVARQQVSYSRRPARGYTGRGGRVDEDAPEWTWGRR